MQISGDIEDLESALRKTSGPEKMLGNGHCSALIKVLPNQQDLYVSQDTWTGYNNMLRILKKYDLQFHTTSGMIWYFKQHYMLKVTCELK